MLCTIALQLAKQSNSPKDEPETAEDDEDAVYTAVTWQTGKPPRDGRYLCKIDMGSGGSEYTCQLKAGSWWIFGSPLMRSCTVLSWWPLPDE